MSRSRLAPCLLSSAAVLILSMPAQAQITRGSDSNPSRSNSKILEAFQPAVAKASRSTVNILCDGKLVALGTIIDTDGYIITKDSELKGTNIAVRLKNGKEYSAKKIAAHEPFDIAMLKIEARDLTPVEWVFSKVAPVGNWVATVGLGSDPISIGVVSVAARKLPPAPKPLPADLRNKRGYLGIQMEPVDQGTRIVSVMPKSAAERAGLKTNDIITMIEGIPVEDPETMSSIIQSYIAGETIKITVKRGNKLENVEAKLDPRPKNAGADRSEFQNNLGGKLSERRSGFPLALQHDTYLKPSDCGGPLVDLEGRVIGINISRGGRTDSYAIPSEGLLPILPELMLGKTTVIGVPRPTGNLEEKRRSAEAALKAAEQSLKAVENEKLVAERKLAIARAALERVIAEEKAAKEKAEREAKMERLPMPRVVSGK